LLEEDRELLVLGIDRKFEWRDLALTALGEDAGRAAVAREVESLQMRMDLILQAVKEAALEYNVLPSR